MQDGELSSRYDVSSRPATQRQVWPAFLSVFIVRLLLLQVTVKCVIVVHLLVRVYFFAFRCRKRQHSGDSVCNKPQITHPATSSSNLSAGIKQQKNLSACGEKVFTDSDYPAKRNLSNQLTSPSPNSKNRYEPLTSWKVNRKHDKHISTDIHLRS